MQRLCQRILSQPWFEPGIIFLIALTAIVVGLETSVTLMERYGELLHTIDRVILGVFVVEILLRMGARWPRPWEYFRSGWNVFDFTIVAVCLLPAAGPWVAVLRLARVLRLLRLVTRIPKLQVLVGALLRSLPSMGWVSLLLALHFYIYAVMGVFLFRENDPGHFGDLGDALLSLFRIVTLEDWTDIMYTAIHGSHVYAAQGPIPVGPEPQAFGIWAVVYFVSFVGVGAMVIINLLVGVMVSSISEAEAESIRAKLDLKGIDSREKNLMESMDRLEEEMARIKRLLQGGR